MQFTPRKLAQGLFGLVIRFAHGGFLAVGIIVTLLVSARIATSGMDAQLLPGFLRPIAANLLPAAQAAEEDLTPEAAVTPPVKRLSDYLSRRYRVAVDAVQPLVAEAFASGRTTGLDPLLLVAVMAVESSFNPIAESSFGAQGLMQVVPRYHMEKIGAHGEDATLLDPLVNIRVGAQVLKDCLERAGNMPAALQAYAGASNDAARQYSARVMSERSRLQQALGTNKANARAGRGGSQA